MKFLRPIIVEIERVFVVLPNLYPSVVFQHTKIHDTLVFLAAEKILEAGSTRKHNLLLLQALKFLRELLESEVKLSNLLYFFLYFLYVLDTS